jgi:hypothetical protein
MSDNKGRAQRCLREAEGFLRCAQQPNLQKDVAASLTAEAHRLLAKAADLTRAPGRAAPTGD